MLAMAMINWLDFTHTRITLMWSRRKFIWLCYQIAYSTIVLSFQKRRIPLISSYLLNIITTNYYWTPLEYQCNKGGYKPFIDQAAHSI
jgi:hypothetical protein